MTENGCQAEDGFAGARETLLRAIDAEVADTARWLGRDILSPEVRAALARVPRHLFVPADVRAQAYENISLPIGHGQTISQPYIVAVMTDLVRPTATDRVLEIGTGCGYQTAVLAELAAEVFTIETVPDLAESARERLRELGYANVTARRGDGSRGWPEKAPFDVIVVTAASPEGTATLLLDQLAPGGRMVIPVDKSGIDRMFGFDGQELRFMEKDAEGRPRVRVVLPVAFVPLVSR